MKNLDLAACGLVEMTEEEMVEVNGGGVCGPPASYWTEHATPDQMQKAGEIAIQMGVKLAEFLFGKIF